MAKARIQYVCSECGGVAPKWQGQCPHCSAWNTLAESVAEQTSANRFSALAPSSPVVALGDVQTKEVPRLSSGVDEFDRVLGGGLVESGVVLIGGDPGIGKSTLLLQALAAMATASPPRKVLYVSGEESVAQVALRAQRLADKR